MGAAFLARSSGALAGIDRDNTCESITRERHRYDSARQRVCQTSGTARAWQGGTLSLPGLQMTRHIAGRRDAERWVRLLAPAADLLRWRSGRPPGATRNHWRYRLVDHQRSSTAELDGAGCRLSREEYYPYGGTAVWAVRDVTTAHYKVLRYAGKTRDASGLQYYGLRFSAPWLMRWLNPDPAGPLDGLNLFALVRGNPATRRDADGCYSGADDEFEAHIGSAGRFAITARGLAEIRDKYPILAGALMYNLALAEKVAGHAVTQLSEASAATHGEAFAATAAGRVLDRVLGGGYAVEFLEQARVAFRDALAQTRDMLRIHREAGGEKFAIYVDVSPSHGHAEVMINDPHQRIFVNAATADHMGDPVIGAMVLLHEATHLGARSEDVWYTGEITGADDFNVARQLDWSIEVSDEFDHASFVHRVSGTWEVTPATLAAAWQAVSGDVQTRIHLLVHNADTLMAVAFALGQSHLRNLPEAS